MLAVTSTAGAMAHAVLVSAEPADGSVLTAVPPSVTLRFNEAMTVGALSLVDARGRRRDDIGIDAAERTVVMTLPSDLPQGSQLVSYRVISADGSSRSRRHQLCDRCSDGNRGVGRRGSLA